MLNAKLLRHFEALQDETKSLLKEVSSLSSSTYHAVPGPGKWSISQIITHILTAEYLSLTYLRKKSLGLKDFANTGVKEEIMFLLLQLSQRMPFRYKAPRIVIEKTPEPLSYGEAVRQWNDLRNNMREFLEQFPDDEIKKKVYRHPSAGMLNIQHAIQFLREHIIHHRPQVTRIIQSLKR